ncbi:MAG: type II toxin-antitoxin system RelE/ParE family toxin [Anaerohalosphaeraceae bacterium]|nr:type II toxin-antitoxin system RelE/ParE family toxin [Anaerohalosphaeraceae bacterium]
MHKGKYCNIEFVKTSNGKMPANEFLENLNEVIQAKFFGLFKELLDSDNGFISNSQKMTKLKGGDKIWELRVKVNGIGNFRIFCFRKGRTWYLTHGFHKKSRHTPITEINRAIRIKNQNN